MSLLNIQLNESVAQSRRVPLFLVDAGDVKTPEGGQTGTCYIQKSDGTDWVASVNSIVEPTNPGGVTTGGYYLELTAEEVTSLGYCLIYYQEVGTTAVFMGEVQITTAPSKADFSELLNRFVILEQKMNEMLLHLGIGVGDEGVTKELSPL